MEFGKYVIVECSKMSMKHKNRLELSCIKKISFFCITLYMHFLEWRGGWNIRGGTERNRGGREEEVGGMEDVSGRGRSEGLSTYYKVLVWGPLWGRLPPLLQQQICLAFMVFHYVWDGSSHGSGLKLYLAHLSWYGLLFSRL